MNGIKYYEDLNGTARKTRYHTTGIRNIYSVNMYYSVARKDGRFDQKTITMEYGRFSLARSRYMIETSSASNMGKWHLDAVQMVIDTYSDMKQVCSEEIECTSYSTQRVFNMREQAHRAGVLEDSVIGEIVRKR